MRESVGGTLLLQIVLVFLTVYIGFMAIVINYGKVFRIKNRIINRIEQNEGYANCTGIDSVMKEAGYLGNYNVSYTTTSKGAIYSVTIYITFEVPIIGRKVGLPVKGETRLIDTDFNQLPTEGMTCPPK